jgi:hypothetical protein
MPLQELEKMIYFQLHSLENFHKHKFCFLWIQRFFRTKVTLLGSEPNKFCLPENHISNLITTHSKRSN